MSTDADRSYRSRAAALVTVVAACLAAAGPWDSPAPLASALAADEETKADAAAVAKLTPEARAKRLAAALAALAKDLAEIKTLRASFVQTKRLEVFDGDVETKGTLSLALPDRFVWETTHPFRTTLVVNGDRALRRRTSRKGDVTETPFELKDDPVTAATVQQIFLWTRGDLTKASEAYTVELVSEAPLIVRAVPKDDRMRKVVVSIELAFAPAPSHLERVTLAEAAGTTTRIDFRDVERNPELADAIFAVETKKGR